MVTVEENINIIPYYYLPILNYPFGPGSRTDSLIVTFFSVGYPDNIIVQHVGQFADKPFLLHG